MDFINFNTKERKIYLTDAEFERLLLIIKEKGFTGRAVISQFLRKVTCTDFVFLDEDHKKLAKVIYDGLSESKFKIKKGFNVLYNFLRL